MKRILKKTIFILIPCLVFLVFAEGAVRLLRLPVLQDEPERARDEIVSLANRAIQMNPGNEKAYLLLGALFTISEEFE